MRKFVLGLFALAIVASPAFAGKLKIGDKAPSFEGIPAVYKDQGASLTLSDLKEDVVVLVFLGNHCPVVGAYEDRIIDLAKAYDGKSVRVVGVSVNDLDSDRLPAIKDRVKEKGYNYVYGYDETGKIARDYGATVTPEFFILDKARVVRYHGALDDNQNENKVTKFYAKDAIDALLAGKEIPKSETQPRGCGIKLPSK